MYIVFFFPYTFTSYFQEYVNRIGGAMVNVFDRGFEPRSDWTKDYKIGIVVLR